MNSLEPIKIKVIYRGGIAKITGKKSDEPIVSEGIEFIDFLYFVFQSYPEIEKIYPPGAIGFLLNKKPPKTRDILVAGDIIEMITK